jgi:hypothetical protein
MRGYAQFYLPLGITPGDQKLAGAGSRAIAQRAEFAGFNLNVPTLRNNQARSRELLFDAHSAGKRHDA